MRSASHPEIRSAALSSIASGPVSTTLPSSSQETPALERSALSHQETRRPGTGIARSESRRQEEPRISPSERSPAYGQMPNQASRLWSIFRQPDPSAPMLHRTFDCVNVHRGACTLLCSRMRPPSDRSVPFRRRGDGARFDRQGRLGNPPLIGSTRSSH